VHLPGGITIANASHPVGARLFGFPILFENPAANSKPLILWCQFLSAIVQILYIYYTVVFSTNSALFTRILKSMKFAECFA